MILTLRKGMWFATAFSGLLLWASWPVSPFTFLIFIAWIPLLWVETKVSSTKKFLLHVYTAMFIWNVTTTWWIWYATIPGAICAFLANSLLMCIPWLIYKKVKKRLGQNKGYIALIAFWMAFEFFHLQDWGLSWPWLTLGNVFAVRTEWIQWYEITGTSGGTLWILVTNILIFHTLKIYYNQGRSPLYIRMLALVGLTIVLPLLFSHFLKSQSKERYTETAIVVVQPNIDPYEKISTGTFEAQLHRLIAESEKKMDDITSFVIWPETALYMPNGISETEMKKNFFLNPLWSFLQRHPQISLLTGIESYRLFDSPTSYSVNIDGYHVESYNAAVLLDSAGPSAFYHKSILVPGAETLPWFLKFMRKWFEKFGGATAGYAKQKERSVLQEKHGFHIAPAICYESIYGPFIRQYIRNGANLICIITNDGWWKNTPGHKQHMHYARLRAIENRRWIARSANTGISCFINEAGQIVNYKPYNTAGALRERVKLLTGKTFYVRYGDVLSKAMIVLAALLLNLFFLKKSKLKTDRI
ncbi:MAG: apolipoprotein N-acyltransferase [Chitinophagaceae bacterium]|nr:apolipoprotein N-acyltransferase [Chitinophagaceae bacterium]